jgi:hypothetical protein
VKPGRPQGTIRVAFESGEEVIDRTFGEDEVPTALLATQELILEVGGNIGLARLSQQFRDRALEEPIVASIEDPSYLPIDPIAYDGVDRVVLSTSDSELLGKWNRARVQALEQSVRRGVRLLISVGHNGAKLQREQSTGAGSLLYRLMPGRFDRALERGPGVWETFAGALAEPMQGPDGGKPAPILTSVLRDVRGEVELADGEVPFVVRAPFGFGEVLFVAADLDRPPISDWTARSKLLLRLLRWKEHGTKETDAREISMQSIRLGYTDLSGQLRSALGQFGGIVMVPFWLVFLLALGYTVLLFPGEYIIARWLRPRFEAAWVLLPLVLLASAGGIWYITLRWKGEETLVNQIEVVDVDLGGGFVDAHSWLGMYSPQTDVYDLRIVREKDGAESIDRARLSWLGLAGTGLGGMNSTMAAPDQFERGYVIAEDRSLAGVPLAAWSSKTFEASWNGPVSEGAAALGERGTDHQPLGIIRNDTGVALRDCVVLYEGWSYELGSLAPGESANVGRVQRLQTIHSYLTGGHTVGDKEQATPYDPEGGELLPIVRAMLFHDAAGGRQFTSLSNRVYHALDWSEQLRLGRAVLVATGPPATRMNIHGKRGNDVVVKERLAIYRFMFPVDRSDHREDDGRTVELRVD